MLHSNAPEQFAVDDPNQTLVDVFEAERPRLRGLAYRMLGTPDDADDIVQETWLRYAANNTELDNPAAWLTTVATRLALDRLRSAQARRDVYVGPWLADPMIDLASEQPGPDQTVVLVESLSLGFLAVLERLSPLERAVFLLSEVFDYPLTEVAVIVERSPDATRQLAKRARDHMTEGRPRFKPEPENIETLTQMLLAAAMTGDIETLKSYLAEDIVHLSDGGPNHRAARAPVIGPHRVARLFIGLAKRMDETMEFHTVRANGQAAMYTTENGEPFMLMVSNWVDGQMSGSFVVRNPEKLSAFHQAWLASR